MKTITVCPPHGVPPRVATTTLATSLRKPVTGSPDSEHVKVRLVAGDDVERVRELLAQLNYEIVDELDHTTVNTTGLKADLELLSQLKGHGLADRASEMLERLDKMTDTTETSEAANTAYQARNLIRIMLSGVSASDVSPKLVEDSLDKLEPLPVSPELVSSIAEQIYKGSKAKEGDRIIIVGAKRNVQILMEIARMCMSDGVDFDLDIVNHEIDSAIINKADDNGLQRVADNQIALYAKSNIKAEVRSNPHPDIKFDKDRQKKFGEMITPYSKRLSSGDMHFCLTIIPTVEDAKLDGMDYEEYMKLFFESCDQPWEQIHQNQGVLVERLDKAETVRLVNDDGTDVSMSIEGQTFANSTVDKNVPGSEVFSSPIKESVNGTLVAKGKFKYGPYPVVEDITLVFENGKVVDFDAVAGKDTLALIITADDGNGEGSRHVGELGIGTNPRLREHVINALLVEKIGGSFHLALGKSYTLTEYNGAPVKVDNGNKSKSGIHWDITTMLRGKGGKMYFDDKLVQDDGIWVDESGEPDPELAVLNGGWGALPEEDRPTWWNEKHKEVA